MNYSYLYDKIFSLYGQLSSALPFGFALPPIRVTIEVTYQCNLRCKMCYQKTIRKEKGGRKELSLRELKNIVDQMLPGTLITLTGGELLIKSFAEELVRYSCKRNRCNIVTNGTLINKYVARWLVAAQPILIGFSIDGLASVNDSIRGIKGSFSKTIEAIGLIQEEKKRNGSKYPMIDVKTVICSENIDQIKKLYFLCKKLGVEFFTVSALKGSPIQLSPPIKENIIDDEYNHFYDVENSLGFYGEIRETFSFLSENAKNTPIVRFYPGKFDQNYEKYNRGEFCSSDYLDCHFPWVAFNVSPYGDVFPCISLNVGSIKDKSLMKMWNGIKMREFREKLKKSHIFSACNGCCNAWFRAREP